MSAHKYTPAALAVVQNEQIPSWLKRLSQADTLEDLNFAMALVACAADTYYELGAEKLVPGFLAAASKCWRTRLFEITDEQ